MALSDIQKLKLEIGLLGEAENLLTDEEIQYFLDKNKNVLQKASLDAAKTVLYILSQQVHERSGTELEIWGHTWFENYMQTLKLYLTNPNFNVSARLARPYAGGISVVDARHNACSSDTISAAIVGVPIEGTGIVNATKADVMRPCDSPVVLDTFTV